MASFNDMKTALVWTGSDKHQLKQANQINKLSLIWCNVEGDLVEWNVTDSEVLKI